MRKIFNILITTVLALVSAFTLVACVDNGNDGNTKKGLSYKKIDDVYTIYKYVGEEGVDTLDIGAILSEAGITDVTIKKGAFDGNATLKTVIVPQTVTEIQAGAFRNMQSLENLVVPFVGRTANADAYYGETAKAANKAVDSARTIAHFFGTDDYDMGKSVTINYGGGSTTCYMPSTLKTVTVKAKDGYKIPMHAFNGANNLKSVVIENGVVAIGESAFNGATELKAIDLPKSVVTVYKDAFNGCTKLAAVTFSAESTDGSIVVKENAFKGCSKVSYFGTKVETLPEGNVIDLKKIKELGAKALDFGNEYKKLQIKSILEFEKLEQKEEYLKSVFGDTFDEEWIK